MDKKIVNGFNEFIKDESYFDKFKNIDLVQSDVLVRLCIVTPKSEKSDGIILQDEKGNFKKASEVMGTVIFPVVKVINKGGSVENDKIEVGGCYTVPPNEVLGEEKNPEWLHQLQFKSEGKSSLKATRDIPEYLPRLVINWKKYSFHNPWNFEENEGLDNEVFLIPWNKLKVRLVPE